MAVATTISGTGDITTNGSMSSASSVTTGNATVGGNLTVTGFYSMKPYVGCFVSSAGVVSTNIKPGFIIPTVAKTTGQYIFTMPTAHPSGANYEVFVQQRTALATTGIAAYGVNVNSNTYFTIFNESTANVLVDSEFYIRTVP